MSEHASTEDIDSLCAAVVVAVGRRNEARDRFKVATSDFRDAQIAMRRAVNALISAIEIEDPELIARVKGE